MCAAHFEVVSSLALFLAVPAVPTGARAADPEESRPKRVDHVRQDAETGLEPGGSLHDPVSVLAMALADPSAPTGLLSLMMNALGETIARVVDRSGIILELTFDRDAGIVDEQVVGKATDLPVVSQQFVGTVDRARVVRDPSGSLIQVVLDPADRVLSIGILRPRRPLRSPGPGATFVPVSPESPKQVPAAPAAETVFPTTGSASDPRTR